MIGNNCECPFIESIPTILQVCGGFGIVLFSAVFVVAKYFKKTGMLWNGIPYNTCIRHIGIHWMLNCRYA